MGEAISEWVGKAIAFVEINLDTWNKSMQVHFSNQEKAQELAQMNGKVLAEFGEERKFDAAESYIKPMIFDMKNMFELHYYMEEV